MLHPSHPILPTQMQNLQLQMTVSITSTLLGVKCNQQAKWGKYFRFRVTIFRAHGAKSVKVKSTSKVQQVLHSKDLRSDVARRVMIVRSVVKKVRYCRLARIWKKAHLKQ